MTGMGNGERSNALGSFKSCCGFGSCTALEGCVAEGVNFARSADFQATEGGMTFRGRSFTLPNPSAPPETVTAEAERLTQAARHHSYGHPADDFAKVTGMALALWGRGPETPKEHAMYLILVKLSREAHEHKRDNLVDIAGYARTIEMIAERESKE